MGSGSTGRYSGAFLLLLFSSCIVVCCAVFVAGQDEPDPDPGHPDAMNLTATPLSIYLGESAIITATVFDLPNFTKPMYGVVVRFNASLGSITNLSYGESTAPNECWAMTNASGMAQAVLSTGLTAGNASVHAWISGVTVNRTVTVQVLAPAYGVALLTDNETKEANSNEQATYYLTVKNIGSGSDTYSLTLTHVETDVAHVNRTTISLAGGATGVVALTVASFLAGNYTTTVEAASAHARANVTVLTTVRPTRKLNLTAEPKKGTAVRNQNASYLLKVTNEGNAADTINLSIVASEADFSALNKSVFVLNAGEIASAYLNVSDSEAGVYNLTLRATSQGDPAVFVDLTLVTEVIAYGVELTVDNTSKVTEASVNATYYLRLRNLGTVNDTYTVTVVSNEAGFAAVNKSLVNLSANQSTIVELSVMDSVPGSYNTTVEARSGYVSTNLTVRTVVRAFYNLSAVIVPDEPQIIVPGGAARYTVTVWNRGNAPDRFNCTPKAPPGITATVNRSLTELLNPEESAAILLTVSSGVVGVHVVNLTLTSQGNASVNATVRATTVVISEGYGLDTGPGTYPSIAGVHRGVIIPNHTVMVKRLYVYPAPGTGGHAEAVRIYNATWSVTATWGGYQGDYHQLSFPERFTLLPGEVYHYELQTGSYPLLIRKQSHTTLDGSYINCTSFEPVHGTAYGAVIPAIRLSP